MSTIKSELFWRNVFMLLILSFSASSVNAQSVDEIKADILVETDPIKKGNLYTNLTLKYLRIDVDQAVKYIDTAGMIPEYSADYESRNWMLYMHAKVAQRRQKLDTALIILHHLADNHEIDTLEKITIGNIYYSIGDISRRQSDFETAVIFIDKAKEVYRSYNDIDSYGNCEILLGSIYKKLNQYDKAIQYYSDAQETFKTLGNDDGMATAILNIASVYKDQGKSTEALALFNKAELIANAMSNADNLKSYIYGNRSSLYTLMNLPQEAYKEMLSSYELRQKNASPRELANSLTGLSTASLKLGKLSTAKEYLDNLKEIVDNNDGMLEFKSDYHNVLSKYYKKRGLYKLALDNTSAVLVLKDSLRKVELDKKLIELNEQLETEQKEKEIIQLNSEKEIANLHLKTSKRRTLFVSGGLAIISLLSIGLFYLLRQTKSQNKIIEKALSDKELLIKEIHHRVKNNLHFISALLGLQTDHVSDQTALDALQEGQDRVQSMALIHQDLYQRDDLTSVNMKEYFVKLTEGLFDSYNIRTDSISLDLDVEELNLDVDTVIPIGLMVNELISNCLKYAFKNRDTGKIVVVLKELNDQLQLTVSDDGVGMNASATEQLGDSLGYKLITALTDQLEGTIRVDGPPGTHIFLTFSKYQKSVSE